MSGQIGQTLGKWIRIPSVFAVSGRRGQTLKKLILSVFAMSGQIGQTLNKLIPSVFAMSGRKGSVRMTAIKISFFFGGFWSVSVFRKI